MVELFPSIDWFLLLIRLSHEDNVCALIPIAKRVLRYKNRGFQSGGE